MKKKYHTGISQADVVFRYVSGISRLFNIPRLSIDLRMLETKVSWVTWRVSEPITRGDGAVMN
jgi:hypothetical protein